jgi:hypothetical protein
MTTDPNEITQAAERRHRIKSGVPDYEVYGYTRQQWSHGMFDDEIAEKIAADDMALADAYLAEHPADDGDVVTPEWLLSVGFTLDHEMEPPRDPVYCIRSLLWRPHYFEVNQGKWQFGPVTINQNPKTRGDVRRLCAALGIPLPDQPKGGA